MSDRLRDKRLGPSRSFPGLSTIADNVDDHDEAFSTASQTGFSFPNERALGIEASSEEMPSETTFESRTASHLTMPRIVAPVASKQEKKPTRTVMSKKKYLRGLSAKICRLERVIKAAMSKMTSSPRASPAPPVQSMLAGGSSPMTGRSPFGARVAALMAAAKPARSPHESADNQKLDNGQPCMRASFLLGKERDDSSERWEVPLPETTVNKPFIMLPDSRARFIHDCLVFLFTFVEFFVIGLSVALRLWDSAPTAPEVTLLLIASLLHCVTVYLNFHTAFLEGWELVGDDIDEVPLITERYMQGWFRVDIVTVIPIDLCCLFFSAKLFHIFSFIRFVRVTKVHRLFKASDPLQQTSHYVAIAMFIFAWLLAVHLLGCVWIFLESGVPSSIGGLAVSDRPPTAVEKYSAAMYFIVATMTTVGYGDIVPSTVGSMNFVTFVMVVGAGMYAIALSSLGGMVSEVDLLEKESRDRKRSLAAFMTKYKVPASLRKEAHALYPAVIERCVYDPEKVTAGLPPWFAARLISTLRVHLLKKISFLRGLPDDVLLHVADGLEMRTVDAGTCIIEHDEEGTEMFLISKGVCDVYIPDATSGKMKWVAKLREGQVIGELGLLEACKRTATVRTAIASELYVMRKETFTRLTIKHPILREVLEVERQVRQANMSGYLGRPLARASDAADLIKHASVAKKRDKNRPPLLCAEVLEIPPPASPLHKTAKDTVDSFRTRNSSDLAARVVSAFASTRPKCSPPAAKPVTNPLERSGTYEGK
ncbi:Potassium channel AKT1 [Diplonema papillatum]|nr:Potassium channel AKT1 [Diplonema papillatum]|eukprot:gene6039-9277_t